MKKLTFITISSIFALFLFLSCGNKSKTENLQDQIDTVVKIEADMADNQEEYTDFEMKLFDFGLVDIKDVDSTVIVYMRYATPDNFMGYVLYDELNHAFMLPNMAEMVKQANALLKKEHPDYTLYIYDAARPVNIQYQMWDKVKGTPQNIYVANPNNGHGMHNYGAAVDITIADAHGNPIPMGTDHDFFGPEAHIDKEDQLLAAGKLTKEEYDNRRLLRRLMTQCGFKTIQSEWWHFNMISPSLAPSQLKLIDIKQ